MIAKQSVVQSTMIKITVLIFCILLMLYFFIARIYWEKEVLNREFELLSMATAVELQIQANYPTLKLYKENQILDDDDREKLLSSYIQRFLHRITIDNPNIFLGYYDMETGNLVTSLQDEAKELLQILSHQEVSLELSDSGNPKYLSDQEVINWDGKGIIGVIVPVFYQHEMIGHTVAIMESGNLFYQSYMDYSRFFVPSIILWIIVLVLIKKSIADIKLSLDAFTQMIVNNQLDNRADLEKLPELLPVYEKIRSHLDNLQDLNLCLEESNEKLLTIMGSISDGFFSLDQEWCFTFINSEAKRMIHHDQPELIGTNIWEQMPEFISPETVSNLKSAMAETTPKHWDTHSAKDCKFYEIHAYPYARGLSVFIRDITEIKLHEGEMVRLERLNLIGQMAAGISHEVRNPLTTVRGFLQMLEARSDSEQNKEYMEIMISEIDRANGIISDFLSLAKANADCIVHENINEIITKIFPMLQADAFNSNKDVYLELGEEVPSIDMNESEIRQLILNLVRNGLEETQESGQVYIRTFMEDECVVLAIQDEGKGIPQEVQDKMGTPFITTKETGTGLGLAISIGISRRHKAKFEFTTGIEGTTFFIKFPQKMTE